MEGNEVYMISDFSREIQSDLTAEQLSRYKSKLQAKALNDVLVEEGYLFDKEHGRGITEAGRAAGIYTEERVSPKNGESYEQILFSEKAYDLVTEAVRARYPELFRLETDTTYLGNYCCMISVKDFLSTDCNSWLATMQANYSRVCTHPLTEAQIRAWKDEFRVIRQGIPSKYSDLSMIFEYVIPANQKEGLEPDPRYIIRPDLIMLSSDTVAIFEFKQLDIDNRITLRPAKKYKRSIQRYHSKSIGMRKKLALVLTVRVGYRCRHHRSVTCSPDILPEILDEFFGGHSSPYPNPDEWIKSEFALR